VINWRKWPIKKGSIKIQGDDISVYYRGNWNEKLFSKSLTVVGSRKMSKYGQLIIEKFMPQLVANKITIISGFMYGVDTEAHQQCLNVGGKTIAVLGCGLNYLTPIENDNLYTRILENDGMVISEYEPDFKATIWSFPQRDRILANISSKGVLVIEAGMKSGSLITARIAKENNVHIWSVPGPITSAVSEGTNWLIKEKWAEMMVSSEQITNQKLMQVNLFDKDMSDDQKEIYNLLKVEPLSIDELSRKINKNAGEIGILVSMMGIEDLVFEDNGKVYVKN